MQLEIRSLEAAKRTCEALGIELVAGATTVRSYYWGSVPADLVMRGNGDYNFGLQKQENGTYAIIGDSFDMGAAADPRQTHTEGWHAGLKERLAKFGDDFGGWTTGVINGRSGHVTTGTPNRFMQEYALQVGELGARVNRMTARRVKLKNGDTKLVITGGVIPSGGSVEILAKRDGSATVGGFGIEGAECLKVSDWALKVIGNITSQKLTADFYHKRKTGRVAHIGALKQRGR